ncbi:MAG: hypothetical protein IPL88_13595 [Rhizobiales bacterium]|nr:hypothetical protein [Hyphomicrobiales bacterium]
MHGGFRSDRASGRFRAPTATRRQRAAARIHADAARARPQNIIAPTAASALFRAARADGAALLNEEGSSDYDALRRLMARLAVRVAASRSPPAPDSAIPSGYTYLLQFIAHDLMDSVVAFDVESGELALVGGSARAAQLRLDTLYGSGPEECPHAYAIDAIDLHNAGVKPRYLLRTGPRRTAPASGAPTRGCCPMRDIARARADDTFSHDPGLPPGSAALTETLLADPRNDAHALLSQLTVLFQTFHNHLATILRGGAATLDREATYRLFHCARMIAVDVYREIVVRDVAPRVVDPRILKRYEARKPLVYDGPAPPLEFSQGVFRFGHAMSRNRYRVNSEEALSLGDALDLSSAGKPGDLPVDDAWLVDWSRFFDDGSAPQRVNFARPIGLSYARQLNDEATFPPFIEGVDAPGLFQRDLLASAYGGLLSAETLTGFVRSAFGESTTPAWPVWRAAIKSWLESDNLTAAGVPILSEDDIARLSNDPPLIFFVLFEAGVGADADAARGPTLGPVGSFVVAEALFAALDRRAVGFEGVGDLPDRMRACVATLLGASPHGPAARAAIEPLAAAAPRTMPQLIAHLEARGAFA